MLLLDLAKPRVQTTMPVRFLRCPIYSRGCGGAECAGAGRFRASQKTGARLRFGCSNGCRGSSCSCFPLAGDSAGVGRSSGFRRVTRMERVYRGSACGDRMARRCGANAARAGSDRVGENRYRIWALWVGVGKCRSRLRSNNCGACSREAVSNEAIGFRRFRSSTPRMLRGWYSITQLSRAYRTKTGHPRFLISAVSFPLHGHMA